MVQLRTVRIADLGRVVTGKTPPSSRPELFGEAYPFLTPTDIDGYARYIEPERFLSAGGYNFQHRLLLPERSVSVVCIGATIGKVCMTSRPSFTNQQINSVVVNENEHDPFFVYHLMTTLREELKANAGGAATPIINKTAFSEIEVAVPPLPVQKRIAEILSAYEDSIENCQRRIKILEQMARGLYREWFVNFQFPNHAKTPMVDSPLGKIPKGWQVRSLGELTDYLNRGLAPSYDENGNSLVINQKCIRDQRLSLEPSRRQTKPITPDKLIRFGDVLVNSTGVGTLGRVAQVYQDLGQCTVDTHVTIVRPSSEVNMDFFGCALFGQEKTFDRLGTGATGQTELSRMSIAGVEIITPPTSVQNAFGEIARPIRLAAVVLASRMQNLRKTRDLLLPRLMSGQINVN